MKKTKLAVLLLSLLLLLSLFPVNAAAAETLETVPLSDSYLAYLELSPEERAQVISPLPFNRPTVSTDSLRRAGRDTLPAAYDGREKISLANVRDQMNTGSCWAFSSTANLATYLNAFYPMSTGESYDFSPRHMEFSTAILVNDFTIFSPFYRYPDEGGTQSIAAAYFLSGFGPVNNSGEFAFRAYETDSNGNVIVKNPPRAQLLTNPTARVRGYQFLPELSNSPSQQEISALQAVIKETILDYGSVDGGINYVDEQYCFEEATNSYYCSYNTTASVNHAIMLVGWDDGYSRMNFNSADRPRRNGAWIVQNSWGTEYGYNGYFYVSYEDMSIYGQTTSVTDALPQVDYDNIYNHDPLGFTTAYLQDGTDPSLNCNVFQKEAGTEYLESVSLGFLDGGSFTVYVAPDGENLSDRVPVASGTTDGSCYQTVDFEPFALTDTSFAVLVEYSPQGDEIGSLGVENARDPEGWNAYASAQEGSSFYSQDGGSTWIEVSTPEYYEANFSIKAFTENGDGKTQVSFQTQDSREVVSVENMAGEEVMIQPNGTFSLSTNTQYIYECHLPDGRGGSSSFSNTFTTGNEPALVVNTRERSLPFTDVSPYDWFFPAVEYCYENGLVNGVTATSFQPGGNAYRAALATILWRSAGSPTPSTPEEFVDVADGVWYTDAISWAAEAGIVNGMGNGIFRPEGAISRQDFGVMLYRFYGQNHTIPTGSETSLSPYTDAGQISDYGRQAIIWCVDNGILNGRTANTLAPQSTIRRSEMAAMIQRFMALS